MSYKKATDALPRNLLRAVQQYIDGESLYIPRRDTKRLPWGANTGTREATLNRNKEIVSKRLAGSSVIDLAQQYFLSPKTIYKIINAAQKGSDTCKVSGTGRQAMPCLPHAEPPGEV